MEISIARALHLVAIAHWIGGVAFVTLVILPLARKTQGAAQRLALFEGVEKRFAAQARLSVPVAGLSGLYLLFRLGGWDRLLQSWPIMGMLAVWTAFMVLLFIAEPLFLHAWFHRRAMEDSDLAFAFVHRAHIVLLSASALVIGAGALAAHGALR